MTQTEFVLYVLEKAACCFKHSKSCTCDDCFEFAALLHSNVSKDADGNYEIKEKEAWTNLRRSANS